MLRYYDYVYCIKLGISVFCVVLEFNVKSLLLGFLYFKEYCTLNHGWILGIAEVKCKSTSYTS